MLYNATIELKAKDVGGTLGLAQHLYILKTDTQGNKQILLGGPYPNNMLYGDILVVNIKYGPEIKDYEIHHDWDVGLNTLDANNNTRTPKATHLSSTLVTADDAKINAIFDKMWQKGESINAEKYDYKIPSCLSYDATCHV